MTDAPTILATAFEPFGGEAINASWAAVERLEGLRIEGRIVRALRLPCAYHESVATFVSAYERLKPDIVVATGQAAGSAAIRVERQARNRDDAAAPDNCGIVRRGVAAIAGAPERFVASAPVEGVARAIRAAGLPARVSNHAGGFVCNHFYFRAGRFLEERGGAARFVFLHVPVTPKQAARDPTSPFLASEDVARAVSVAIESLLAAAGSPLSRRPGKGYSDRAAKCAAGGAKLRLTHDETF
jgi:pyroglutamyl-peptidase